VISGRQALSTIEEAVGQLRGDESRLDAALQTASDQAARLRAERMEAFRDLARLKLDALTRDAVVGELDAAERRALDLLSQRRHALERLASDRQAAAAAVAAAEAERHARAEALEKALQALADKRAEVEARARDAEWATQRSRIEAAASVAAEAEKKAVQAEADREEKRKPYESDPLFMYLWNRRFGTAEYRAGPFVRFFDRKVARLVGYDKARANYVMLNEIPRRLKEHAERVRAEIEPEQARLRAVERAELVKAGVETLERQAAEAKARLDEAERALARTKAVLAESDREHDAAVTIGDDPVYRQAVELLATADARQDLHELYREAMRTPSPKDEAIVRRIEATEQAIGAAEQEMGAIRRRMQEIAERRVAIEHERDEFRRRGYDGPRGSFGNEQILGQVLGGVLGGVLSSTVLRDVFRDNYHRSGGPWDSDFGGGFPFPTDQGGGWSGGGSSGGGPWGDISDGVFDGAGDSGDGFRTGGSF